MSKLNIIGLGYIGLPTALMFAANGVEVVGSDFNKELIDTLNNKQLTFEEDGLEEIFKKAIENKIEFTTDYIKTDKYIITVPTPYIKDSKKIDPKYVINAFKQVLEICENESIVIIESTVSPGTIEKFIRPIIEEKKITKRKNINLVHAPERIIPGNMIEELRTNSRTIGADSTVIAEKVSELYKSFCQSEIVLTDIKTAELSKVVENTFRDINIAFANELAQICNEENIDVYELIKIANKHPRVNILQPGPGVGGHCISVDPWFLVGDYPNKVNIIKAGRIVNDSMPKYVLEKIKSIMCENNINDFSEVGLYGLTYKENVDDMRESPTLQLLEKASDENIYGFKVYDPMIKKSVKENNIDNFKSLINNIKLLVILVAHDEIKSKLADMKDIIIYDTKNITKGLNNKNVKIYNI